MKGKGLAMKGKELTKEEVYARAAQWAFGRHKSNPNLGLSKYQARNIDWWLHKVIQ